MRLRKLRLVAVVSVALLFVAAAIAGWTSHAAGDDSNQSKQTANPTQTVKAFDPANLDTTAAACQDFNQFANGGWMAKNPIPPAYAEWGKFDELSEKNKDTLRRILEADVKNARAAHSSNDQKLGDYYASCMDEVKIETDGSHPLDAEFARIAKLQNTRELQDEIAHLHTMGVGVVFRFGASQDAKNSTQVIGIVGQGGLGLPDRDYYLKDDAKSKQIRDEYLKHVARMFELMGDNAGELEREAQAVMAFETALAKASMTRVEQRDPNATYHKMTLAQLKELTPDFSWSDYLRNISAPPVNDINVAQPNFLKEVNQQLTATPLADWKTYLRWRLIDTSASSLSSNFVNEDFHFKGTVLTGTKELQPRWKRCVDSTDRALGEALGQEFVKENFPPEAKARALQMVQNLIAALQSDLSTLSWMSDATRKQAINKLNAFQRKIGYPDKWRDYTALKIDRGPFVLNRFRSTQFGVSYNLNKIGKPVDRMEWGMTPPTVNAYYSPLMNEIVFPAGILQPPFFNASADDAVNYGAMGAVIGHEMTHGFDDQGAQFDAVGNLQNWWTPEDLKNFQSRTECIVNQFNSYVVDAKDNLRENGKLVAGESIADLGGLTIAYAAFQKSMEGKTHPANIDGFSPEQRFFLGWAQVWAANIRPEYARLLANTNPHPLAQFRVNGPLSNMPQFAQAYGCKKGDAMVREERCQIW